VDVFSFPLGGFPFFPGGSRAAFFSLSPHPHFPPFFFPQHPGVASPPLSHFLFFFEERLSPPRTINLPVFCFPFFFPRPRMRARRSFNEVSSLPPLSRRDLAVPLFMSIFPSLPPLSAVFFAERRPPSAVHFGFPRGLFFGCSPQPPVLSGSPFLDHALGPPSEIWILFPPPPPVTFPYTFPTPSVHRYFPFFPDGYDCTLSARCFSQVFPPPTSGIRVLETHQLPLFRQLSALSPGESPPFSPILHIVSKDVFHPLAAKTPA